MQKKKRTTNQLSSPSRVYRDKRDRIEVHVEKGLRNKYKEAVAPDTLKGGIEGHMKDVVRKHEGER